MVMNYPVRPLSWKRAILALALARLAKGFSEESALLAQRTAVTTALQSNSEEV
jgi:hypothetical protein